MAIKILHKRDDCIGCNACVEEAPNFFSMEEDGKSTLKNSLVTGCHHVSETRDPTDKEDLKNAEESCPVNIIIVSD
jgi:ferredoxin